MGNCPATFNLHDWQCECDLNAGHTSPHQQTGIKIDASTGQVVDWLVAWSDHQDELPIDVSL
jgi:hypothetical protein